MKGVNVAQFTAPCYQTLNQMLTVTARVLANVCENCRVCVSFVRVEPQTENRSQEDKKQLRLMFTG